MWCGDEECEIKMKEIRGMKSRCIVDEEKHFFKEMRLLWQEAKHLVYWGIQY